MHNVMAFNAVSAPALVAKAIALRVDRSLDDEPPIQVLILANDDATLARYMDEVKPGFVLNPERIQAVALTDRKYVKVMAQISGPKPTDEEL